MRLWIGLAVLVSAGAVLAQAKSEPVFMPASDLKWVEMGPDAKGVMLAPIHGDYKTGPYATFAKLPAGDKHPLHTHPSVTKLVVVSGTFMIGPKGGPEKAFGPGSYAMVPANWEHTSACAAGAPCVIYQEGDGKFDVIPVGAPPAAAGAKKPAPAKK
jgi:quercetin dioxygenase-like cupin family protein